MLSLSQILLGAVILALAIGWVLHAMRVRRLVRDLMGKMSEIDRGYDPGSERGYESGSATAPKPTLSTLRQQFTHHLTRELNLVGKVSRREQLMGLILDSIRDAVLVVDRSNTIRFSNTQALEYLAIDAHPSGHSAKQLLLDHRLFTMLEKSTNQREHLSETIVQNAEMIGKDRDRVLEVEVTPLVRKDKDLVSRTSIIIRDVTARHEVEQVRRDFVANASHELRTPLSIINGHLENLLEGGLDDEETTRRFLTVMKKHGDRLTRIIEDMLAISKLESSPQEVLQMEHFDLETCARDVVSRLGSVFEERKAHSHFDFPAEERLILFGDHFYWDQILFNLIENALKENKAEGLNITVAARNRGGKTEITVSDDGVGIPQNDLPFIFKRFYRGDKHHSQEKKGTGLGLSIVKRAVEAHGGTVIARSRPGRETAFVISVPKKLGAPPPDKKLKQKRLRSGKRQKQKSDSLG